MTDEDVTVDAGGSQCPHPRGEEEVVKESAEVTSHEVQRRCSSSEVEYLNVSILGWVLLRSVLLLISELRSC